MFEAMTEQSSGKPRQGGEESASDGEILAVQRRIRHITGYVALPMCSEAHRMSGYGFISLHSRNHSLSHLSFSSNPHQKMTSKDTPLANLPACPRHPMHWSCTVDEARRHIILSTGSGPRRILPSRLSFLRQGSGLPAHELQPSPAKP